MISIVHLLGLHNISGTAESDLRISQSITRDHWGQLWRTVGLNKHRTLMLCHCCSKLHFKCYLGLYYHLCYRTFHSFLAESLMCWMFLHIISYSHGNVIFLDVRFQDSFIFLAEFFGFFLVFFTSIDEILFLTFYYILIELFIDSRYFPRFLTK